MKPELIGFCADASTFSPYYHVLVNGLNGYYDVQLLYERTFHQTVFEVNPAWKVSAVN